MQNYVDYSSYIIVSYSIAALLLLGFMVFVVVRYRSARNKNEK